MSNTYIFFAINTSLSSSQLLLSHFNSPIFFSFSLSYVSSFILTSLRFIHWIRKLNLCFFHCLNLLAYCEDELPILSIFLFANYLLYFQIFSINSPAATKFVLSFISSLITLSNFGTTLLKIFLLSFCSLLVVVFFEC